MQEIFVTQLVWAKHGLGARGKRGKVGITPSGNLLSATATAIDH